MWLKSNVFRNELITKYKYGGKHFQWNNMWTKCYRTTKRQIVHRYCKFASIIKYDSIEKIIDYFGLLVNIYVYISVWVQPTTDVLHTIVVDVVVCCPIIQPFLCGDMNKTCCWQTIYYRWLMEYAFYKYYILDKPFKQKCTRYVVNIYYWPNVVT